MVSCLENAHNLKKKIPGITTGKDSGGGEGGQLYSQVFNVKMISQILFGVPQWISSWDYSDEQL